MNTLNKNNTETFTSLRNLFNIPRNKQGAEQIYFCGNSLGLMPKITPDLILEELEDWKKLGVEGHMHAARPWMPYHEILTDQMSKIVGAFPSEVVVMNSLTVNLHLMMVSFYRPKGKKYKVLIDYSTFPSDRYAIASQLRYHGFDPKEGIIELTPDIDGKIVSAASIEKTLEHHGEEIALILIGAVNYYTGQLYDIKEITRLGHQYDCIVGFDLAHAAGNIDLNLHEDGPDFAAWCSYKYLNSGPGSLSGCFIHQRHHNIPIQRFEGWWGHDKNSRFMMGDEFQPIPSAEAWQLSNPPILSMAAIKASLDIFALTDMKTLRELSLMMSRMLIEGVLSLNNPNIRIITPKEDKNRGCQVSIQMLKPNRELFNTLTSNDIISDWREPDVIRLAPVPLYNTFEEINRFLELFDKALRHQ